MTIKGIPTCFSPELLYALAKMGHGDRIAMVDGNYPAYSAKVPVFHVALPGEEFISHLLEVIPLDTFVSNPIQYMQDPSATDKNPTQLQVLESASRTARHHLGTQGVERFDFYEATKQASAVVALDDYRPYLCFLITHGVI